jgi:hypothetical protein
MQSVGKCPCCRCNFIQKNAKTAECIVSSVLSFEALKRQFFVHETNESEYRTCTRY